MKMKKFKLCNKLIKNLIKKRCWLEIRSRKQSRSYKLLKNHLNLAKIFEYQKYHLNFNYNRKNKSN